MGLLVSATFSLCCHVGPLLKNTCTLPLGCARVKPESSEMRSSGLVAKPCMFLCLLVSCHLVLRVYNCMHKKGRNPNFALLVGLARDVLLETLPEQEDT